MARGKKKETLTPEERLQVALVPEDEQPYKVPGNWCWIRLKASINLYNGDRGTNYPSKKDYQSSGVPFINAGAIVDGELNEAEFNYISEEKYDALRAGKIQQGDILYCLRGSLGKTAIVHQKFKGAISSSLCILRVNESLLKEYLYYLLCSNVIGHQQVLAENGSAQPNLSAASVMDYMIPLAPLAEQQRITDRIESLFAKLDEAKQKAQNALDSFETRKAAILHKTFTGELTAQWRREHGVGMESWENKVLWQLAKEIKAGGDKPDDFTEEADETHNIPVVANGVVDEGIIGYTATARFFGETVTVAGRGTIGFSVYRTYSFFPIVRLIVIQPKDFVKAAYIKYAFDAFPESGTGSSIPQLTVPMVKEKVIPLPELEEQTEIIRILDDLLAKEQQAKETVEGVLEQIDLIKKAILARAFRGELGTNDPSEESAVELLKQISSY